MSKNRFLKNFISIILIFCCAFLFSSCRRSEVLVDVRYEMQADSKDEDQKMLDPDDQGQKDDRFQNEKDENQDRKRDTDNSEGIYNDDEETTSADQSVTISENEKNNREWNDTPVDSDKNKETDTSETASGDQESETSDDNNAESKSDESETAPPETTSGDQESETSHDNDVDNKTEDADNSDDNKITDPDKNTEDGTGDNDNDHNVPDGDESDKKEEEETGETEVIPKGSTYTATGFAAQVLIMLDEGDKLLASDDNTVNDTFIGSSFTDTEIWWEGDGSSPISDENFSLLIEAGPEICFVISGQNTFTESQVSELAANGIKYSPLYPLDSWEHLKENVTQIANATEDESAISKAKQYASWVDSIIGSVQACETRMNTLFIKDWDYSAQVSYWGALDDLPKSISGAAMTYSRGLVELDGVSILKGVFGSDNVTGVYDCSVNIGSNNARNLIYAVPYLKGGSAGNVSGNSGTFFKNVDLFSILSSSISGLISATELGDELFPAVVTENDSLKELIENDPFWAYYRNENYYEIYVAPYGTGSITEGSLDSPLLAMWVSAKFGGGNTLEQVRSEALNFYSEFLGKDISGSVEYMYR